MALAMDAMTLTIMPLSPGARRRGHRHRSAPAARRRQPSRRSATHSISTSCWCIRDQDLSEDDQLRAAGYFGKVACPPPARQWTHARRRLRHAVHDGDQHRRERQADRRLRRRRDVVPPRHQLLPRAASRHAALFDEAAVLGRQYLLLQHVQGLREHPARAARPARRPQGAAGARLQAARAARSRQDRSRQRSATTSSRSSSPIRRPAGRRSISAG